MPIKLSLPLKVGMFMALKSSETVALIEDFTFYNDIFLPSHSCHIMLWISSQRKE